LDGFGFGFGLERRRYEEILQVVGEVSTVVPQISSPPHPSFLLIYKIVYFLVFIIDIQA